MINVTARGRHFLVSNRPGLKSLSVSDALAQKSDCRIAWQSDGPDVRRLLPRINEELLLTDDGGAPVRGQNADGYLSAVWHTGPERVWPFDTGVDTAATAESTRRVLIDAADTRYAVNAADGPALGVLRGAAEQGNIGVRFAGSLAWGTASLSEFDSIHATRRFQFYPTTVPEAGQRIVLMLVQGGAVTGWFAFRQEDMQGPVPNPLPPLPRRTRQGIYFWTLAAADYTALRSAFTTGSQFVILLADADAAGFRQDYRQVFSQTDTRSVSRSSLRAPATSLGVSGTQQVFDSLPERGTADFSVAGWVRLSSEARAGRTAIIAHGDDTSTSTGTGWRIFNPGAGTMRLDLLTPGAGSGFNTIVNGTAPLDADTWYHFAAVRGADGVALYLNGAPDGTGTETTRRDLSGGGSFTAGADGVVLDDVAVWDRALTRAEVGGLYAARTGLSGMDAAAVLDSALPRALVTLGAPHGRPMLGSADLPYGGAVTLADRTVLPGFGRRQAATDYSQAMWLRIHSIPEEEYDVRLPSNDAFVPADGTGGSPVQARDRDLEFADAGGGFFAVDRVARTLLRFNPASPGSATVVGTLPAGMTSINALASHQGELYAASGAVLWRVDTVTPADSVRVGFIGGGPAGEFSPVGMTSFGGNLYGVTSTFATQNGLLVTINPSNPPMSGSLGQLPARSGLPRAMASFGALLIVVSMRSNRGRVISIITDNPGRSPQIGVLPANIPDVQAAFFSGGAFYVVSETTQDSQLWRGVVTNAAGLARVARFPPASRNVTGIDFHMTATLTAGGLDVDPAGGGNVTALAVNRDGGIVLTVSGTLEIGQRRLVLLRADGDRALSSTYEADLSGAAVATTSLTWPAGTIDGTAFHTQAAAAASGWTMLIVDDAARDFDEDNLEWKPAATVPKRIYGISGATGRPSMSVDLLPGTAAASADLVNGPVRVSPDTPLRMRYTGPAADRTRYYAGAQLGILVAGEAAGLSVLRNDGGEVAVKEISIGQAGGGRMSIALTEGTDRLDFNAALVVRCGGATVAADLTSAVNPPNLYRGPAEGAYQTIIACLDRGLDLTAVVVERDAMGVDTAAWTWGTMSSVRMAVTLRGPDIQPDDARVEVPWPHDGSPHLLAWSLARGALRASVDGAGEVTAPTRGPGSIWGADEPPASAAFRGRQVAFAPAGAGVEAGVTGQMLVQHGTHAYRGLDGSTFYLHRIVLAHTSSGDPAVYRLAVALSASSGAVYSAVPDAAVDGLTLLIRLWHNGQTTSFAPVLTAGDRQSTGNEAFVLDVPDPGSGFSNQSAPEAVDLAAVNAAAAGWDAANETIAGNGPDLYDVGFDSQRALVSQFSTAARAEAGPAGPLRLWHSESRGDSATEIASFGTIHTPADLTGTGPVWELPPEAKRPTRRNPSLRGGTDGITRVDGDETIIAESGGITYPDGERVPIVRLSFFPASIDFLRLRVARPLPAGADDTYRLLLEDGEGGVDDLAFSAVRGAGPDGAAYEYRWARPSGFDARDGVIRSAAVYDSAQTDWATGPGASPPDYTVTGFTFPVTRQIALLAVHATAAGSGWTAATGPHLQLLLDSALVLPGHVLANYTLFLRVPSTPEGVLLFPLAAPDHTAVAAGLRGYYWIITPALLASFRRLKALYRTAALTITMQDVGNASYRPSDQRIEAAGAPFDDPVLGGVGVGDATLLAEWRRVFTAAEAGRMHALRAVGRVFSGRVKQSSVTPLDGDYALRADVAAESLAADLDDRLIKSPVTITAGMTLREAAGLLLSARGVRSARVTDVGGRTFATGPLRISEDGIDTEAGAVPLQDTSFDADYVSAALDRIVSDSGLDAIWFVDRSNRLVVMRAASVPHRADVSMREVVGRITVTNNRDQLRNCQLVQGGPPEDVVKADPLAGDGATRFWTLRFQVTSVNRVSVIRSAGEGAARDATFSVGPDPEAEWIIDADNGTVTQNPLFPPVPSGGTALVEYASNHPARSVAYDFGSIRRYGQIDAAHEDKSILSIEEADAAARAHLRRNSEISVFGRFTLIPGAGDHVRPGVGIRITGSDQVDGEIVRLVQKVARVLLIEGPGPTRWNTSVECVGTDTQAGTAFSGRVPMSRKQEARSIVRLHVSERSLSRETGTVGVLAAASYPWILGGDPGTWESHAVWRNGDSSVPFPVDGRRTRQAPHELQVSGKVQAAGTVLEVRLTQDGAPVPRAQVRITSADWQTIVISGILLNERLLTLRFQTRTIGAAGARIHHVQVVPVQEVIR